MNKTIWQTLIAISFLIASCTSARTAPPATMTQSVKPPPSQFPTSTNTSIPTETPTASITPLPTIPTFTPTFDVSTILTITPAPQAECQKKTPYPHSNFDLFELKENSGYESVEEVILWFLNNYDPRPLVEYARNSWGKSEEHTAFQDFTNDGVPELAMGSSVGITAFHIFGCKNGRYEELLHIPSNGLSGPATFFSIKDNNRNGLVELTLLTGFLSQGGHFYEVYEWDGEKFASILSPYYPEHLNSRYLWVQATGSIHYEDVDKDFHNELILDSGVPVWETYYSGLPWRNKRTYYKWNGQNYIPYKREFAQPEFRFQAVQDGDLAFSQKEYEKALNLYQEAIFSEKLNSYSPEIRKNLQAIWDAKFGDSPTPTPYPVNHDEYPKLAAYAYYRMILLHLVQGDEVDAETAYKNLQEKFGNDQFGQPYAEMATAFWEAYQSTQRMYDGCAAAIQYAAEHPGILIPLGSDYHGSQSHTYVPADVCPFR